MMTNTMVMPPDDLHPDADDADDARGCYSYSCSRIVVIDACRSVAEARGVREPCRPGDHMPVNNEK